MRSLLLFAVGALCGAIGAYTVLRPPKDSPLRALVPLKVELTRFRMKPGTEETFAQWMDFHRQNHAEMRATLDREQMVLESIFLDEQNGGRDFYWLSVEGPGGEPVEGSQHPVDHKHIEFAKAVIDRDSKYNLVTQFVLMPVWLENAINRGLTPR